MYAAGATTASALAPLNSMTETQRNDTMMRARRKFAGSVNHLTL
jgi:hypothetical protein